MNEIPNYNFGSVRISVLRDIKKSKKESNMLDTLRTFILHNNRAEEV